MAGDALFGFCSYCKLNSFGIPVDFEKVLKMSFSLSINCAERRLQYVKTFAAYKRSYRFIFYTTFFFHVYICAL